MKKRKTWIKPDAWIKADYRTVKEFDKSLFHVTDFCTIEDFLFRDSKRIYKILSDNISIICPKEINDDYFSAFNHEGLEIYNRCCSEADFILKHNTDHE